MLEFSKIGDLIDKLEKTGPELTGKVQAELAEIKEILVTLNDNLEGMQEAMYFNGFLNFVPMYIQNGQYNGTRHAQFFQLVVNAWTNMRTEAEAPMTGEVL